MDTLIKGNFIVRKATLDDAELLLSFIYEMAKYENEVDHVKTNIEKIKQMLTDSNMAEALIGEYDGVPVCYAIYFYTYSSYLGKKGLYLEDLFVKPEMRGKGLGTIVLSMLAKHSLENDFERFEWSCLDWNKKSIDFYLSLNAVPQDIRTTYRMTGDALEKLAQRI